MALNRILDAATEPISLAEAKAHLRVTHTAEDALIAALITAARQACESETNRSLVTQTWVKTLDLFPVAIELPNPPVVAIASVQYVDATTRLSTMLSPASYTLDNKSEPGWLVPAYGYDWPVPLDVINAVTITYTAGYGDASAVPEVIKAWIKLHLGNLYANRESFIVGAPVAALPFAAGLLDPYRLPQVV
jgi:uncharacterized phiE125 gp8 family phage protein